MATDLLDLRAQLRLYGARSDDIVLLDGSATPTEKIRYQDLTRGRPDEVAWPNAVIEAAGWSYDLGVEVACCQRLVKGYGDTHARGLHNFEAVMAVYRQVRGRADAPKVIRNLRDAALGLGFVTAEEFDRIVDPAKMVHPYVADGS